MSCAMCTLQCAQMCNVQCSMCNVHTTKCEQCPVSYLICASVHVNSALWSVRMQCDLCMCACEKCTVNNVICACVRPAMGRRAASASAPSAVTAAAPFCTSAICIGAIGSQPSELHHTDRPLLHFLPLICQHICTNGMLAFSNFSVS